MINSENNISVEEIEEIIKKLTVFNSNNIYENNKYFHNLLINGIYIERNDDDNEDFNARIIDFDNLENNIFKVTTSYKAIAEYLFVDRANLMRELKKMEKKGLIEKKEKMIKINV